MTLYEKLLSGYVFQPITNPVYYKGKPVGILCDPGHGLEMYTTGKRSPDGRIIEGRYNREMVARIIPTFRAMGIDARCIVPEDEDIKLEDRTARANKIMRQEPDKYWFYFSFHLNAAPKEACDKYGWCRTASGTSAYAAPISSDDSKRMARIMVATAAKFGLKGNRSIPSAGYWSKGWYVIRETKMPAILTETLFMTNPAEVDFLLSEKGKQTIESMYLVCICDFFSIPYAHVQG